MTDQNETQDGLGETAKSRKGAKAAKATTLEDIAGMFESFKNAFNELGDIVKVQGNQIEELAAGNSAANSQPGASGSMDPASLTAAVASAMQPFLVRLDEAERRSVNPMDEKERLAQYNKDLQRDANKEREALEGRGVRAFYAPDPVKFIAEKKRIVLIVRTIADEKKARLQGYYDGLENAAQVAKERGVFPTLDEAREAIHAAAGREGDTSRPAIQGPIVRAG